MTTEDIKGEYLQLIDCFLKGEITANEFSLSYLDKMKGDSRLFGRLYDLLEEMFGEANSYTDNQDIYNSDPGFYITDQDLRLKAVTLSEKLRYLE